MKPAHARHRIDTGSAELIELLEAAGARYVPLGGAIDGAAFIGQSVVLIDFKRNAKAPKTKTQAKLVAQGAPIWFVASEDDVLAVVHWLRRAA